MLLLSAVFMLGVLGDVTFAKHALTVVYFTACVVAYSMRLMRDFLSVIMRYRKTTLLVCSPFVCNCSRVK